MSQNRYSIMKELWCVRRGKGNSVLNLKREPHLDSKAEADSIEAMKKENFLIKRILM